VATVRARREMRNPFLARKRPDQLTCEDCGLDFDRPNDAARESARSPWNKP
jgi:hypothetical protein